MSIHPLVLILIGIFVNMMIAVTVYSNIDTPDQRLFKWIHHTHEPYTSIGHAMFHMMVLWPLVMNLWPIVALAFLRTKEKQ